MKNYNLLKSLTVTFSLLTGSLSSPISNAADSGSLCPADKQLLDKIAEKSITQQLKDYEFINNYCPNFTAVNRYFLTLSYSGDNAKAEALIGTLNKLSANDVRMQLAYRYSLVKHFVGKGNLCKAKEYLAEMQNQWCSSLLNRGEISDLSECQRQVKPARLEKSGALYHTARSEKVLTVSDFTCMLHELPLRSFVVEPEVDIKAHFKRGSSSLEEDSLKEVKNLAIVLQSPDFNEIKNITIVGHADVTGNADPVLRRERNQQLSLERANTVKNFLATQGNLAEKNFTVQGKGDTQPLINMDTPSAYKANRRVEVILN